MRKVERALAIAGALVLGWTAWTWIKLTHERSAEKAAGRDRFERQMY